MSADQELDERLREALGPDRDDAVGVEVTGSELTRVSAAVRARVGQRRRRRRASVGAAAAAVVVVAIGLTATLGGTGAGEPVAAGRSSTSSPTERAAVDPSAPATGAPLPDAGDVLAPLGACRSLVPADYRPGDTWSDPGADEPGFQPEATTDTECGESLEETLLQVLDPAWSARTYDSSALAGDWLPLTDESLGSPMGEGMSYSFDRAWATVAEPSGGIVRFEVLPIAAEVTTRMAEQGRSLADLDGSLYPLPGADLPVGWSAVSSVEDRGHGAGGRVTVGRTGRVGVLYRVTYHRLLSPDDTTPASGPTVEQIHALALELVATAPVGPLP